MFIALIAVLVVHGLIHLLGFVKAFSFAEVRQITAPVRRIDGVLWLVAGVLFGVTALLVGLRVVNWWMCGGAAVLLSQYLIIRYWHDANFGTVANIVLSAAIIAGIGHSQMTGTFRDDVASLLTKENEKVLLQETDLAGLPEPVRKYVRYTGAVGKPRVSAFRIDFEGQIRKDDNAAWMPLVTEQYNTLQPANRLFFMKATMMGIPVTGYHRFVGEGASMDIRLLSLLSIEYMKGAAMDTAETVTFFNDMCVFAPGALVDKRIEWLLTIGNSVMAQFTNNGISISAWLHFNDEGQLINFVSDDRYALQEDNQMKKVRWSTPLSNYTEINGMRLAGFAATIYHYNGRDLKYGEFRTKYVAYW